MASKLLVGSVLLGALAALGSVDHVGAEKISLEEHHEILTKDLEPNGRLKSRSLFSAGLTNNQAVGFSYYAEFLVANNKKVQFLMDTGSSDIWINSQLFPDEETYFTSLGSSCCSTLCCKNSTCSKTGTNNATCKFQILYGSGPTLGDIGLANFQFANTTFNGIQIGYALSSPVRIPAIMGLAMSPLASFTFPTFTSLFSKFTFQFNSNAEFNVGNTLFIGKDAEVALPTGYVWKKVQVDNSSAVNKTLSNGHWSLVMTSVTAGGNSIVSQSTYTIFDSGTSLLVVPGKAYTSLMPILTAGGTNCRAISCVGTSLMTCSSLDGLVGMNYVIDGVQFMMAPDSLTLKDLCNPGEYSFLIDSGATLNIWILGLPFLRAYQYTKFDTTTTPPSISVACLNGVCNSVQTDNSNTKPRSSGISTISLVLIVIGAVAAVVGIGLVVYYVMKKRPQSNRRQYEEAYFTNQTPVFATTTTAPAGQGTAVAYVVDGHYTASSTQQYSTDTDGNTRQAL